MRAVAIAGLDTLYVTAQDQVFRSNLSLGDQNKVRPQLPKISRPAARGTAAIPASPAPLNQ